ncbi:MAG: T9SS type A sorting domain-containing protein [Opitutaceae bacterium]|nr:T9SS type A sorting domain-containing protein [Cytophagales bacterium]
MTNKYLKIYLLLGSFLIAQSLYSQTIYNIVVGSANLVITSTNGYDNILCGADPESFSPGCGDKHHVWQAYRNKAYLTTTLPGSFYSFNNFPNGKPSNLTILAASVTPGQYFVEDHSYVDVFEGTRDRNCKFPCSCTEGSNCVFLRSESDVITTKYVINIESAPVFNNLHNFNGAINQFTVCSGDPAFFLSNLVDKTGVNFLDQNGTTSVPGLFDPKLSSPKKQADTVLNFTMSKSYYNGAVSKKFSIKIIKSSEITTAGNASEFNICKNVSSFNVADVIKATPIGGTYFYNGLAVTSLNPKDISSTKINITYIVTIGLCKSQRIVSVNIKEAPKTDNITSIGTFCNNLTDLPLKFSSSFPYFSDSYDPITGMKQGIIKGKGVKSAPIGTPSSGVNPTFVPSVYDTLQLSKLPEAVHTLYYELTNSSTGCVAIDTFNVTIKAPVIITGNKNIEICNETLLYNISKDVFPKGGVFMPASTTYLANDTTLNIGKMPLGKQTINYTYKSTFGCISSADFNINIQNKPSILMPNDTTICEKTSPFKFIAFPAGGTWTGSAITANGVFTPSNSLADTTYKLTYSLAVATCSDSKNMFVKVVKSPLSPEIFNAKNEYCTEDSVVLNAAVANSSGLKYNWYQNDETAPFVVNNSQLKIIADKNLKRILVEAINSGGCASKIKTEKQFTINDVHLSLVVEKDTIKKGELASLKASVIGDVIKDVFWNFGDSSTGSGPELVHYYYDTGNAIVTVKVMTLSGCVITKFADTIFVMGKAHQINTAATYHIGSMTDDSENYLEIYPNPSEDGKFNLYIFLTEGRGQIIVQDLLGENVISKNINQIHDMEIDLSSKEIKSGMYILRLIGAKGKNRLYKIVKK